MIYSSFDENDVHAFDEIPLALFEPYKANISVVVEAPSFSIPKLSKSRNKIYHQLINGLDKYNDIINPDTCSLISIEICKAIDYPVSKFKTVYDSLHPLYLTKEVSLRLLYNISTKISGNVELVRDHKVIPTWETIDVPIWVPVEVVSQQEIYGSSPGKEIKAFITGGIPSGMTIIQCVSNKFIQYMLREIGYPKYQKFDAKDIYNTRFTCNM